MKRLLSICIIVISLNSLFTVSAQELAANYKKRHAIYDYTEKQLNNTDTIPGFGEISEKLKISGTIYKSDGVTPAEGVILYICQPDDYGDYHSKKVNGKRVLRHKGWVKTNADGQYTFYTFIPGTYWPSRKIQQIHGVVKVPGSEKEYAIAHFVFENDPLLRKSCKKKLAKSGLNNLITLEKKEDLFIGERNIILSSNPSTY